MDRQRRLIRDRWNLGQIHRSSRWKVKREKNPLRKAPTRSFSNLSPSFPRFDVLLILSSNQSNRKKFDPTKLQRNFKSFSTRVFFLSFFISSKRKRNISTGGGDDFNATRRKILCYCGWVIKIASGICTFFVVSIAKMGIFVSQVKVLFFLVVVNAN